MIAIVNYGVGNIRSVEKAFLQVTNKVKVISSPSELEAADKVILPGVAAYGQTMENIKKLGFAEALRENVLVKKKPLLGFCVGMQVLSTMGTEFGTSQGLNFIPGRVQSLREIVSDLPVPNVGWCEIQFKDNPIFAGLQQNSCAYFLHSFYFVETNPQNSIAKTTYGNEYTVAVAHENIWGLQFHPEKSQKVGLQILSNFVNKI